MTEAEVTAVRNARSRGDREAALALVDAGTELTVAAKNSFGTGPASACSNAVKPT
jgi:hypothetical protein